MIPSCAPSCPMTRISRARIFSLTLSFLSMASYLLPPSTRGVSKSVSPKVSRPGDPPGVHLHHPVADGQEVHRPEVTLPAAAHRHGARLGLAVSGDQHEGDLLQLGVAGLGPD